MLNARKEMELDRAVVCQNTSEILTPAADLNVFRTLIAIVQKHVLTTNVKIHALESVESTQSVVFKIMLQFVFV